MRNDLAIATVSIIFLFGPWILRAAPRGDLWKQVEEAVKKGLPKSAIEALDPIIDGALKDKAYAEAVKAIGRKIALEGTIEGNEPEEKIIRLQAEIAKAPSEMKPAMEAILAHWYWQYFQRNRWRFMERTQTAAPPGEDFTTWDLPRILAEIDGHFAAALADRETLRKTPIGAYDDLLDKGTMPDAYRPALYDFLAHEALAFYCAGEQAGARVEDAFDLPAESPIFAAADGFIAWDLRTTDEGSPTVKAIRLYQDLLRFHRDDADRTAFLDADLDRLVFGYEKAFGEEKAPRYKAALRRFAGGSSDHEISARARFQLADVLRDEGDLAEAHRTASEGKDRFLASVGGKLCANLIAEIESKSAEISTERVWNKPFPMISVRYRNVTEVHFRAIPYDWTEIIKVGRIRAESLDANVRKAVLGKQPALAWSADLPPTPDFRERVQEIPAPEDLAPGFYYILASHDRSFREEENKVTFLDVWVSDLALVIRHRHREGSIEGFVLDANRGEPIPGAEVRAWWLDRNRGSAGPATRTDANGFFRFLGGAYQIAVFYVRSDGRELATWDGYPLGASWYRARPSTHTIFFTDRSLYRPGQTIRYKGICIEVDEEEDDYAAIPKQKLTVVFEDANGEEIARQAHRTNAYGSFSGSFTAPRDRLMGEMRIRIDGEPSGGISFHVEEYKRPKFQVAIDPPVEAAKLGAEVEVKGRATAYTGAAVDRAQVRYRVVREVRYPDWWGWWYGWGMTQGESQEIAHGTSVTGADGNFSIRFVAKPDPSVLVKDEPTFRFTVHADVTDAAGETRSADRTVSAGYTALRASLSAGEWQTIGKAVEVKIRTESLDGEGQRAEGVVKLYKLKEPEKVLRPPLAGPADPVHPSNPNSWPLGDLVAERNFTTDAEGKASAEFDLPAGAYRALLATKDRFGKPVSARLPIQVIDPTAKKLATKIPDLLAAPAWTVQPGETFTALWGSGYDEARAFVEIEHRGKVIQGYWTEPGATQAAIEQKVGEKMRGGFLLRVTRIRENRAYLHERRVDVPWSNKELTVTWEHFVSKLEPGGKQTWTAIISGPGAQRAVAEMVATLYDASLDAYLPHVWPRAFGVFREDHSSLSAKFENQLREFQHIHGGWRVPHEQVEIRYRAFPAEVIEDLWGYEFGRLVAAAPPAAAPAEKAEGGFAYGAEEDEEEKPGIAMEEAGEAPAPPDLSKVSARANLNETAFFFPHLVSGKDGVVRIEFAMPEALTEWRFMGFAHDADLRSGFLQDRAVTSKDLMVQPNPPRFVREGDVLEFTVKVTNQSAARQTGSVRLTLADARTGEGADAALGNAATDLAFDIPSKESRSFSWRLNVPDGLGFLTYKALGSTGRLSDGEEGYLPVLARRILVTESLPLPIRGARTKTFDFARLRKAGESDTLRHQSLTVQMVSQPSWYAVMALPYLMEFPYECSEQVFNRLYANALARHIATSDPKIRRVFDRWRSTPALDSPLEKNQDLKAVAIEETPWVRQAQAESQARRNVGVLFDENRMNDEIARAHRKLVEMQGEDGMWPWFPGGRGNEYITLYISTGFGRLRHLGVEVDAAPAIGAIRRLDAWIDEVYRQILRRAKKEDNHLSPAIALYLYGRSFFLKDEPIAAPLTEVVEYFLGQAKAHWLALANRQSQAHLAIALKRFGDAKTAQDILRSIRERSVSDEELGMFWRETELSWWWYRAPIETQAMMIEAFDEVAGDAKAVEDCKVWLLKQKQTQDWKTTKATADAVYASLLRGANLLASTALVEVSLGGEAIRPEKVEAGTGFYERRFAGPEVKAAFGEITVRKVDEGVSWGSVHWQYLEAMSKIAAHEGTPLKLRKALFVREYTGKGPVLRAVQGPLAVGDELVVRIELRVDRDMEYVHLKDQRGSGTEPVNVLSAYRYQDGLAYYESTRDTASHFFIDYLPKGTYVFEYATRVVHRGRYQTGMAQIQCMYAPEFNSHSESFMLEVR